MKFDKLTCLAGSDLSLILTRYRVLLGQEQGASELVLDLRDNRGGLVSEGVEVARLFLDGACKFESTTQTCGNRFDSNLFLVNGLLRFLTSMVMS